MIQENTIEVKTLEELYKFISKKDFFVRWKISSDIGPGWIGRKKEVSFYFDRILLKENSFLKELKGSLIKLLEEEDLMQYNDHVIIGKGIIILENNYLKISYDWEGTIPYQYSDIKGKGEGFLLLETNDSDTKT